MPLWEGFDELYHYGCVQHLATARTFPVTGSTMLSLELWTSLDFLPVSTYIQPYLGRSSTSLDEYFHLAPDPRPALRHGAGSMDRAWRTQPSPHATVALLWAGTRLLARRLGLSEQMEAGACSWCSRARCFMPKRAASGMTRWQLRGCCSSWMRRPMVFAQHFVVPQSRVNNSFTTFSATTLNAVLALLALAVAWHCASDLAPARVKNDKAIPTRPAT